MTKTKPYTRLSPETWAEIEELYELGAATISELSDKYGPAERTIKRHMSVKGIKKGTRTSALIEATKREIRREAIPEPKGFAERFRIQNENTIKVTRAINTMVARELNRLDEDPFSAAIRLKALQLAAQITIQTQKVQRTCFGADNEHFEPEELPELIIRDLTQQEIEDIKANHEKRDVEDVPLPCTQGESYGDIVDTTE